jgi:hypothetical protein
MGGEGYSAMRVVTGTTSVSLFEEFSFSQCPLHSKPDHVTLNAVALDPRLGPALAWPNVMDQARLSHL